MMTTNEEKTRTLVYQLNGITYLPHYSLPNRYVYPGYDSKNWYCPTFSSKELADGGATPYYMELWTREWSKS